MRASLAGLLLLAVCASAARAADVLALRDGRFFEGTIEADESGYVLKLEHGEIRVPKEMVLAFLKDGAEFTFEPTTEKEKEKVAKGLLPWGRRWVRAAEHERLRKLELEKRKKNFEQYRERRLWRNRATVETRRFIFEHTLPDEVFEEFKDLFETYYDYFTKYWNFRPSSKFGKVTINIYHDRDYFEQVSGARRGTLGYYVPTEKDLHFFYDRENHDFTVAIMFHEGNHMLTHMIDEDMWYPWWIGEGMAEYFGASEWDREKKEMTLGHLQSGRLAVLHYQIEEQKMLPLEQLVGSGGMGPIEYSWAWSLCHFLLHSKYEKRFKKYYMGIARDKTLDRVARFLTKRQLTPEEQIESFKKYMKVKDLEEIQTEWYDYINTNLRLEGDAVDWGDAGYIMDLYGEVAKARLFYKRAIDAGSTAAFVHYGYAKLKYSQGMPGIAAKYAEKAVELDPLHARAWSLWGLSLWAEDNESEQGWRYLEMARELDAEDQNIWFALELARQVRREKAEKAAAGG